MFATQQQPDDRVQQPGRVMRADVAGDALAGHAADARADLLDRRHQREAEQHHPAHRVAELRAGLRVGGDAARIVVGGAGDQSRAEPARAAPWAPGGRAARCRAMRAANTASAFTLALVGASVIAVWLPAVVSDAVCSALVTRTVLPFFLASTIAEIERPFVTVGRPKPSVRFRPIGPWSGCTGTSDR